MFARYGKIVWDEEQGSLKPKLPTIGLVTKDPVKGYRLTCFTRRGNPRGHIVVSKSAIKILIAGGESIRVDDGWFVVSPKSKHNRG